MAELKEEVAKGQFHTARHIIEWIQTRFNVPYSESGVKATCPMEDDEPALGFLEYGADRYQSGNQDRLCDGPRALRG